ncbi:histidine phosphatase family protein [Planococcus sp. CAU13]|uniref:histidine phosphatase family protein n=1 Tax=Planococcus sp. CAU13 TaxID=1541197 RepID=UPI0005300237|nr:histidine phosphatase family protein [Planococcus sp. CAU13]
MEKTLYLIRHCQATGQAPDAELTAEGMKQAEALTVFFKELDISHIISSPFTRAIQSIEHLAVARSLPIQIDDRLAERVLSSENLPDWLEKLEQSFSDPDLKFEGGETAREAVERGAAAMAEAPGNAILVTHGNMMGLLLKRFEEAYGFEEWKALSNPDVYILSINEENTIVKRIWK